MAAQGGKAVASISNIGFNSEIAKPSTFDRNISKITYKNKNEENISWGAGTMSFNICAERISRYLEEEYFEQFGNWWVRVSISWRFFN